MITVARKKLQHLWRGDEGVALAMFIIVCPTVLLIAFSAFQLGEVVRQRIILQNATDAGAYAGAVVQADALSRLGVLNEAMAWTYVQGTNLQQDLVVGNFLNRLIDEYNARWTYAKGQASCSGAGNCPCLISHDHHIREREDGWPNTHTAADNTHWGYYVGVPYDTNGFTMHGVYLNGASPPGAASVTIEQIHAHIAASDYRAFVEATYREHLGRMRNNLQVFRNAADDIVNLLHERINAAIDATFMVNAPHVDRATQLVKLVNFAGSYIERMTNADEANFVGSVGGFTPTPSSWWRLNSALLVGIGRSYANLGAGQPLEGWFQYGWREWYHPHHGPWPGGWYTCEYNQEDEESEKVRGAWQTATWDDPLVAFPFKLRQNFIGRNGTIVVGAKCPVENPFYFEETIIVDGVSKDIKFNFFTAPFVVDQDIWCVSAARAGLKDPAEPDGRYRTLLDVTGGGAWNLYVRKADWDAVMLPLNKAWKTYDGGNWAADSPDATPAGDGNRAKDVLYTVYHTFPTAPSEYADLADQWTLAQNATFH